MAFTRFTLYSLVLRSVGAFSVWLAPGRAVMRAAGPSPSRSRGLSRMRASGFFDEQLASTRRLIAQLDSESAPTDAELESSNLVHIR